MASKELLKHEPEIDEQIKWTAAYIIKLREEIETDPQPWMHEDLRHQKAIYQSLCASRWMIEACTNELKKEPGNQAPEVEESELVKLRAFKAYVHERLDAAGIEREPNGEHSKHGCRIGDRLDIVFKLINKEVSNG